MYILAFHLDNPSPHPNKHPFTIGALRHIATITRNARRYHVYRLAREADEVY
jgi:hypothetical protein